MNLTGPKRLGPGRDASMLPARLSRLNTPTRDPGIAAGKHSGTNLTGPKRPGPGRNASMLPAKLSRLNAPTKHRGPTAGVHAQTLTGSPGMGLGKRKLMPPARLSRPDPDGNLYKMR